MTTLIEKLDPSGFNDYALAVGHLTIHWARVESSLDYIVAIIFPHASAETHHKEIPRSLKPKIGFLKASFKKVELLSGFSAEALSILSEVSGLKEKQHTAIHGTIARFPDNALEGAVRLHRVHYEPLLHRHTFEEVSLRDIVWYAHLSLDLAKRTYAFAERVREHLAPYE